jgi:hypothetical protein
VPSIHVILREYAGDRWQDRIVSGEAVSEVEQWLAMVEEKPLLPAGASGKPLAWLCIVSDVDDDPSLKKAIRSIGLLTDVLRVLDRSITVEELQSLRSVFERFGQPYDGTVE